MSEELNELKEHAEHAKHDPTLAPVSVTMAVLAVLVAVVSLLGHRAHTEEVVLQAKATDQWAFYQAKNVRRHLDDLFTDLTAVQATTDAGTLGKLRAKYSEEASRYKDDQNDLESEARTLETEVLTEMKRADRYDLAEVFLEVGLVITSITLLSGRKLFWMIGLALGVAGTVIAMTGFLIH
ncbi:MAG TPA: DUF4337 domain-containing protein [Candidatus Sulfotelmatobacter sp.]|jgi:chorismate mutase|nr:DUF4337 domain-containing protein [Candidatus Sulfotelmatobacter sp.]